MIAHKHLIVQHSIGTTHFWQDFIRPYRIIQVLSKVPVAGTLISKYLVT